MERIDGRGKGPEMRRERLYPDEFEKIRPYLTKIKTDSPTDEIEEIRALTGLGQDWEPSE